MKTDLNIYKYIKTGCFKAVFLSELSHFQPVTPTVCADFYTCFCFHSWWKPSSDTWCGVCCPAGCDRARALHRRKVQISLSSSSVAAEGGSAEPELYYVLVILLVFM